MSIITLITGIMAAINQMLAMRTEDEVEDDELETFARELDEVEARLDEHEAQLDVLQEDHNPVR